MTSICMNCENAFISNGPNFTCGKCHGPCDTFRYSNYDVDESFYDATHNRPKGETYFGYPCDDSQELPFRRRVPRKPETSKSTTLKKTQATDQFRVFGYRFLNFCSRSIDPFTWLEMLRDSKSKYDAKTKGKVQTRKKSNDNHDEEYGESSPRPL